MTSPSDPPADLTVDRLAARVGMTVRNVRAYAARGLLQPPRLVGRTGYYGQQHVERLTLVREMLAEGYTLTAIEKSLATGSSAAALETLALRRSLLAPWLPDEPYETDLATLAATSRLPPDLALLDELTSLGLLERLGAGRVRVQNPTLFAVGQQVVDLGIDARTLLAAQRRVLELVEQAAATYVQMFHDTVWSDFVAAGSPEAGWARMQEVVAKLQPIAAQAVLAAFRVAMAEAVAAEIEQVVPPVDTG